jgi:ribosomal protein L37AE/L43A
MKVIITQKQLEQIRENASKKFSCDKCEHSWKIEKEDKHPYLCHMCGYDSAKEKHNYDELENFWKTYKKEEEVTEKWSEKYKKSINCNNPKGFSQRAHCQGRKKNLKESEDELEKHGFNIEGIKTAIKLMSQLSETYAEEIPLNFSLHNYFLKKNEGNIRPILQLFIDVDKKDGEEYKITQMYRHEISVELLHVLEMLGLYNDEKMSPYYYFHFNKRSLTESENKIGTDRILGRKYRIDKSDEPYTFIIDNNLGIPIKMKISTMGTFINIVDVNHVVEEMGDGGKKLIGYKFKGKSGTEKLIETPDVKRIIEFVDNDIPPTTLSISLVKFEKIK